MVRFLPSTYLLPLSGYLVLIGCDSPLSIAPSSDDNEEGEGAGAGGEGSSNEPLSDPSASDGSRTNVGGEAGARSVSASLGGSEPATSVCAELAFDADEYQALFPALRGMAPDELAGHYNEVGCSEGWMPHFGPVAGFDIAGGQHLLHEEVEREHCRHICAATPDCKAATWHADSKECYAGFKLTSGTSIPGDIGIISMTKYEAFRAEEYLALHADVDVDAPPGREHAFAATHFVDTGLDQGRMPSFGPVLHFNMARGKHELGAFGERGGCESACILSPQCTAYTWFPPDTRPEQPGRCTATVALLGGSGDTFAISAVPAAPD